MAASRAVLSVANVVTAAAAPVDMLAAVVVMVGAAPALTVVAVPLFRPNPTVALPPKTALPFQVARVVTAAYSVRMSVTSAKIAAVS